MDVVSGFMNGGMDGSVVSSDSGGSDFTNGIVGNVSSSIDHLLGLMSVDLCVGFLDFLLSLGNGTSGGGLGNFLPHFLPDFAHGSDVSTVFVGGVNGTSSSDFMNDGMSGGVLDGGGSDFTNGIASNVVYAGSRLDSEITELGTFHASLNFVSASFVMEANSNLVLTSGIVEALGVLFFEALFDAFLGLNAFLNAGFTGRSTVLLVAFRKQFSFFLDNSDNFLLSGTGNATPVE
jgi:hypothetical protein